MKFIDEATIQVKAGNGGPGASHFRREKYVPFGGPDGGDGGHGGSIVLEADSGKQTLLDFKFNPSWKAESGKAGGKRLREGKSGADLIIKVPVGTQVYGQQHGEMIADLSEAGAQHLLARGGRGGKGNAFFKSATNQAPAHAQPGEEGEAGSFLLSLKLVADVGLIGFPNAGKSTLISRLSAARPKIADYPFTTLVPNLGVVRDRAGNSFVVADIPGLIPGAHAGKGLGIKFLKHVERTRALAHLIDPLQTGPDGEALDPLSAFDCINHELRRFSPTLAARPQIVVLTKADAVTDRSILERAKSSFSERGTACLVVSSATGEGLNELVEELGRLVKAQNAIAGE